LSNRLTNIDSLRGIAAMLVVLQHTSESFIKFPGVAENGNFFADMIAQFDFGRIGIVCFFLISGFVIPFSLKHSHIKPIKTFIIRRFFRLFPVYWVSLLLIVLLFYYFSKSINPFTVLANTTMLQSFFNQPHMIGLYWTLQVELIFYSICAVLFYFRCLDNEKLIFIIIILGFTLFVASQALVRFNPNLVTISKEFQLMPFLISIMFLGSLFRMVYNGNASKQLKLITGFSTVICFGPPLLLLALDVINIKIFPEQFRFGAAHTCALLLFIIGMKLFKKSNYLFVGLGAISYSLYLFHPIVMRVMIETFPKISTLQGWHVSFYMMIAIIISIILSMFTYRMIEKPFINYSYKF
jgi:peptidoglycan/LPS O-acetylase OafA/YrhL